MPIPTELVGSLPRPMKLQEAYADYDEGKIYFDAAAGRPGRSRRGLDQTPGGDRRADRHRRRAARVELCHLQPHRHARGNRAGRRAGRRRPVLRDLRRRPQPPAAADHQGPVPLQDLRLGVRRQEQGDRHPSGQAGGHLPVDDDAAVSAGGRDRRLLARPVPRGLRQRGREGHPPVLRRRRGARLGRLHRGPAGQQERLAQSLDRQEHAAGVHRPQQPAVRPLHRRGAQEHRDPHLPGRRLRLGALQGGPLRAAAGAHVRHERRATS